MSLKGLRLYDVSPRLPEELAFLEILSSNLWWSWNEDAKELFRRVNLDLWRETRSNPVVFLRRVRQERLVELASEGGFMNQLEQVRQRFQKEVLEPAPQSEVGQVAYFSLEHGVHESIRIYSGGLGVLAGDHLKSSSDLGLPLTAVGLLYHQGYFDQRIDSNGWQQERNPTSVLQDLPIRRAEVEGTQRQLIVGVPLPQGEVKAAVWRLDVGRVPLYLLSTDITENAEPLRDITRRLYSADPRRRLQQELLLGIGGTRALEALGITPDVYHMNEGHAAFLNLARVECLMKRYELDHETAREVARRTTVFTTHTPVPAGNETFHRDLVMPHLEALRFELKLNPEGVMRHGQTSNEEQRNELSMTVLGMRTSHFRNGVSGLHGEVARGMWSHLWPEHLTDEIPIGHVTNGVHARTWLSADLQRLYEQHIGEDWVKSCTNPEKLSLIERIPDEEIWHAHERSRARLIRNVRRQMEADFRARSASPREVARVRSVLNHGRLTIGFARRAATYKRLTLLLHDPERFKALLTDEERPIQMIFAAKAHPADIESKGMIRQLIEFTRVHGLQRHIVFVENYDMHIARQLVQGVDVWLNNPRRPQEASGTSGMKAALNGVLNASILDGWWDEAFDPSVGWAFGLREQTDDCAYQDSVDAQSLYNLIEEEIAPSFYDRGESELPRRWVKMMKASIQMALGRFTTQRMVREYADRFYAPASRNHRELVADNAASARGLVKQRNHLRNIWKDVHLSQPKADRPLSGLHVGDGFHVEVNVHLGLLRPEEVRVELHAGGVDEGHHIRHARAREMLLDRQMEENVYVYRQAMECTSAGRHGFTVRVLPRGDQWKNEAPGFITWAESE